MPNHYETLGVNPGATPEQIKRAWRKKCREHHPDREGGSDERMQEINRAYECLSDPEKRAHYDRTGEDVTGPSLDDIVRNEVIGLFAAIAESPAEAGLLAVARRMVKGRKREFEMQQSLERQKRRTLKKKRGRIRIRTKASDLYAHVVDSKLKGVQDKLDLLGKQIEVCVAVDRYLDDYESVDDEASIPVSGFITSSIFGSTTSA